MATTRRATWKKEEKLKSRKHIERVFREGKSFAVFPYKVIYLLSPAPAQAPLQAGFGASSRHFKKAVDRNRIKRLGREAYRLQKASLHDHLAKKGLSMAVFFVFIGKELPEYTTVTAKIAVALQKLIRETA